METYVPLVVGRNYFKKMMKKVPVSKFVTVSDEAFALLILKNNEYVWPEKYKNLLKKRKDSAEEGAADRGDGNDEDEVDDNEERGEERGRECIHPRYTNRRRVEGHSREGWTSEGMEKFNEYYGKIQRDRRSASGEKVEEEFLKLIQREGHKLKNKHNEEGGNAYEKNKMVVANDWGDECDYGGSVNSRLGGGAVMRDGNRREEELLNTADDNNNGDDDKGENDNDYYDADDDNNNVFGGLDNNGLLVGRREIV